MEGIKLILRMWVCSADLVIQSFLYFAVHVTCKGHTLHRLGYNQIRTSDTFHYVAPNFYTQITNLAM